MTNERRFALLALAATLPFPTLGVLIGMIILPHSPVGALLFFVCKLWVFIAPLAWHLWVDRQDLNGLRISSRGVRTGLITGATIFAAILAVYHFGHGVLFDTHIFRSRLQALGLGRPIVFLSLAAYWILINSLLEEYLWRWFVVRQFERVASFRAAVFCSAMAFTVHHIVAMNVYFPWPTTLMAAGGILLAGLAWSWLFARYRSIWPGYVSHVMADLAVFAAGYFMISAPGT